MTQQIKQLSKLSIEKEYLVEELRDEKLRASQEVIKLKNESRISLEAC